MGELDFVVKKGLNVKNGDATLTSGNLVIANGEAQIDNITINANSISSTNTDGNLNLTANGTGVVTTTTDTTFGNASSDNITFTGSIKSGTIIPLADETIDIGTTSIGLNDVHFGSGGIINFDGGDVTLTHATNTLTVAGGTLAAAAISGTTIDATTDFTIGSTVITDDSIVMTPSTSDTITIAAAANGILNITTVDANATAADVNLTADGQILYRANDAAGHIFNIGTESQMAILDGSIVPSHRSSGTVINNGGGYTSNTTTAMVVDGTDARTNISVGSVLVKSDGTLIGTVTTVVELAVTMSAGTAVSVGNNDVLYVRNDMLLGTAALKIDGGNFDDANFSSINIDGGSIDGTTVGSSSASTVKATNLETTSWAKFNGSARESTTDAQFNGIARGGSSNGSTLIASEVRLHTDIANDDLGGSWDSYHGMANVLILDNAENAAGGGQVVVFTEGRTATSGLGSSWAIGRERAGSGKFTIGYLAKSYEDVGYANGAGNDVDPDSPAAAAQSFVEINTAGDLQLMKGRANASEGRLIFSGEASGGTDYTVSFKAPHATMTASSAYTWPIAPAGGNDYVLTAQTNGTLAWAASASGADGMGAGFTVSATTDTTATTIVTGEDLFFAASGGLTAETTADGTVTHGLDINGLTAAVLASGDFLAFSDENVSGDPTKKESIDDIATLFAGTGLTASSAVIGVDAAQTQITSVGTIGTGTWEGTAIGLSYGGTGLVGATDGKIVIADGSGAPVLLDVGSSTAIETLGTIGAGTWQGTVVASLYLDADTAHLGVTQTFTGAKTFSTNSVAMSAGATIDGAVISLDATTTLNIDNSNTTNGITIGTLTNGVPITIGHGTSETTFGDNVTITGNLTVSGTQTVLDTTTVISEDKSFVLGIAGGMADATYQRSGTTVTVTSTAHGLNNTEYVLVQDAGNSITDDVYVITSVANVNTFTFTSVASGTVSSDTTFLHSSADTTEAIVDGAGIYTPGTTLHSLHYDTSHGWQVTDDLDIADTKHISFNGNTKLTATEWFGTTANSMTSASALVTVSALDAGSITENFGAIDNGTSNITTGGIFSIDIDNALTIATDVTGIGVVGSVTLGAGADAGLYVNGDNLYIENKTQDKDIIFRTKVGSGNTYTTIATIDGSAGLFDIVSGKLGLGGTAVTSTAAELNLIDGSSVGTVANSKAVIYSAAGQVEGTTLGINSKAVIKSQVGASSSSSSGAAITIFSFAHATYRAAKILLSIDRVTSAGSAALAYETAEILVNHDGTDVYYTTYGYISSEGTQLATITAAISGANVVVKYDPIASTTDVFNFEAIATLIIV